MNPEGSQIQQVRVVREARHSGKMNTEEICTRSVEGHTQERSAK